MTDNPTPPLSGGEEAMREAKASVDVGDLRSHLDCLSETRRGWCETFIQVEDWHAALDEIERLRAALSPPPQDGEREKALEMLRLARLNGQFDASIASPWPGDERTVTEVLDAVEAALSASGQGGKT